MKTKLSKYLSSPFPISICLLLLWGLLTYVLYQTLQTSESFTPLDLGIGILFGFLLVALVYFREKGKYQSKTDLTVYRTTSSPKYVFLALLFVVMILNTLEEFNLGMIVAVVANVYILLWSIILFAIRNNRNIVIL